MLKGGLFRWAVLLFFVLPVVPAAAQQASTAHGKTAHPTRTKGWVETRLYFGLGPVGPTPGGTSEAAWLSFLDTEVTPRFPAGLSVADLYGQWQGKPGEPVQRLRSKVLILDYPASHANAARIEAIRTAWKQRTGDLSVLRVTQPADVSF